MSAARLASGCLRLGGRAAAAGGPAEGRRASRDGPRQRRLPPRSRGSPTRAPRRSCAPRSSPAIRSRAGLLWPWTSPPTACATRGACSRESATARASRPFSASASSAGWSSRALGQSFRTCETGSPGGRERAQADRRAPRRAGVEPDPAAGPASRRPVAGGGDGRRRRPAPGRGGPSAVLRQSRAGAAGPGRARHWSHAARRIRRRADRSRTRPRAHGVSSCLWRRRPWKAGSQESSEIPPA